MKPKIFDLIEYSYYVSNLGYRKAKAIVMFDSERFRTYNYIVYDEYDFYYGDTYKLKVDNETIKVIDISDEEKLQMIKDTKKLIALKIIKCRYLKDTLFKTLKDGWEVVKKMNKNKICRDEQLAIYLRNNFNSFKNAAPDTLLIYASLYLDNFTKAKR